MTEHRAAKKFIECVRSGDVSGARRAVKRITIAELNTPDDSGRTLLARFAAEGDAAAVEALLDDGRCDWSIADADGKTAPMLAERHGEVKKLFACRAFPDFIFRNGEAIPKTELRDRIESGTLAVDRTVFDSLGGDFFRALLAGRGKVSKRDFEEWMEVDKFPLYWEAQIALLLTDPEYAQKFVDWDDIRAGASADEWLSFLRDLPEYADEADWEMLNLRGSDDAWERLLAVRPELAGYRRRPESPVRRPYAPHDGPPRAKDLEEYKRRIYKHLTEALHWSPEVAKDRMAGYGDADFQEFYDRGYDEVVAATMVVYNE